MPQSIAVAVIHGAGSQRDNFAGALIKNLQLNLKKRFKTAGYDYVGDEFVFKPIYWGGVFNEREQKLWENVQEGGRLNFPVLRKFFIEFLGDAIAYQPTNKQHQSYERVHEKYSSDLSELSIEAGENAPLSVIAHSLGTVITSNFFYDLQVKPKQMTYLNDTLKNATPLEKGETLAQLITLGSPLALWSLRYASFDAPIQVPSPHFHKIHPKGQGSWLNIYDQDDVLAFPLKTLSPAYDRVVKEDKEVNVGTFLTSWNPASHFEYVEDADTVYLITEELLSLWKSVN